MNRKLKVGDVVFVSLGNKEYEKDFIAYWAHKNGVPLYLLSNYAEIKREDMPMEVVAIKIFSTAVLLAVFVKIIAFAGKPILNSTLIFLFESQVVLANSIKPRILEDNDLLVEKIKQKYKNK